MSYNFDAAGVLDQLTRASVTVSIRSATGWLVTIFDGNRTSQMDSRYPGDDAAMFPWPLPGELAPGSREAALDLLEWLASHGERQQAAGQQVNKFRPAALRLFVHDQGYNNPNYYPPLSSNDAI
jgi:hypothetical protein